MQMDAAAASTLTNNSVVMVCNNAERHYLCTSASPFYSGADRVATPRISMKFLLLSRGRAVIYKNLSELFN